MSLADGTGRRIAAAVGTAAFLVLAPGMVDIYIPWLLTRWRVHPPFLGFTALRILGVLLIAAGATVVLDSFARFAMQGIGTPAPVFPTQHLIVRGFYRFVRNPMYVAVVSIVLGQALFFGSLCLLVYGIGIWGLTHLFVLSYEEPTLRRTFGPEYASYCAHVPRWLPRLVPWQPEETTPEDPL